MVTISCPVGDLTSRQTRQLADLARKYSGDHIRTSVEQNLLFRWVSEADLPALYNELKKIGLGELGAGGQRLGEQEVRPEDRHETDHDADQHDDPLIVGHAGDVDGIEPV